MRVLISVSDKSGIVEFAKQLRSLGAELISTGGTAKALAEAGIPVTQVSDVTGFPEMLDGRVKTLHPKIHGGILAVRSNPSHMKALEKEGIRPIDMVVINLYPFKQAVAKGAGLDEAIENIDIGGPALLRAAAKNFCDVAVVVNPARYEGILKELKAGGVSEKTRAELALEAFQHTADYDAAIAGYLGGKFDPGFPAKLVLSYDKVQDLRYGENPHQKAAFYREPGGSGIASAVQLHGKELSFNNINDASSALGLAKEFECPAAVVVKHNNPCGAACGGTLLEAYRRAQATDTISSFGGIIALNRRLDADTAEEIRKVFTEVVIAPDYDKAALAVLKKKKDIRLLKVDFGPSKGMDVKKVSGGLLYQTPNDAVLDTRALKVVTKRAPTQEELRGLAFAFKVAKHTVSNAIVFSKGEETIGVGAGQMNRLYSVELAAMKAQENGKGSQGAVMASDAFFPFRDGIDAAAKAGVTAVIQPGGSIRDAEVIAAADEHGMAMVFSGIRCFRH